MRRRSSAAETERVPDPLTLDQRRQLAADCLPALERAIENAEGRGLPSRIPVAPKLRDGLRRLFAEPGRFLLPASSAAQRVLGTTDNVMLEDLRAIRGALHALAG
jgi:hypothetical protein